MEAESSGLQPMPEPLSGRLVATATPAATAAASAI